MRLRREILAKTARFIKTTKSAAVLVGKDGLGPWEAPFKAADLTGRTLQFGMVHGRFAKKAYIAYVKLVPLMRQLHREHSFDQVAQLLNEKGHRTIIGTPFNGPTVCRILQRSKS